MTGYTPMPLRLETERLVLTPEVESDAPWFAELLTARGAGTFTVDDERERIAAMALLVRTIGIGALVLRPREDDAPSLRVLDKLGFRRDHVSVDDDGEIVWLVATR